MKTHCTRKSRRQGNDLNEVLFEDLDHNITAGDSYPMLHLKLDTVGIHITGGGGV